jgi:hypothetical protein
VRTASTLTCGVVVGITITARTAELVRAQRHALGVVAGRGANHALFELLRRQVRHLVVGAAQLEAEDGLLVFALEQHLVVQAPAQVFGGLQR